MAHQIDQIAALLLDILSLAHLASSRSYNCLKLYWAFSKIAQYVDISPCKAPPQRDRLQRQSAWYNSFRIIRVTSSAVLREPMTFVRLLRIVTVH